MMTNDYRFALESRKVTGKAPKKFVCSRCGKKTFVRYVDCHNGFKYIDSTVGKCDRENHCRYHYTPWQYYNDHPWLKKPEWHGRPPVYNKTKHLDEVLQPLPSGIVDQYQSPQSTFWYWMVHQAKDKLNASDDDIARVYKAYQPGATDNSDIIFWQVDEQGLVHTGHIMQYGPDGHRLSYQNWMHSELLKTGQLPQNYVLQQCFFGQHLLVESPDKPVCIVESEKTALVLATVAPEFVWLACGGCGGLSPEKMACLKGRQVKVIPDSGCYEKWCKKLKEVKSVDYFITNELEIYAPNTDLADIVLGEAHLR